MGFAGWAIVKNLPSSSNAEKDVPIAVAKRINLRDTVIERGTLASQQTIGIDCQMEGYEIKIIEILPEGTVVKKGDVVVRFDSSNLEKEINEFEQNVANSRSAVQTAKEELIVQEKDNETAIRAANQALEFAKIDQEKYLNGDFKVSKSDLEGAISEMKALVDRNERTVENTRIRVEKGFVGFETLRVVQQELRSAKLRYQRDQQKLEMLLKYDHKKSTLELQSKVDEAEFKLRTEKALAESRMAQKKQQVEGKENELRILEERLERQKKNLEKATVKAPADGTLAYSRGRWRDDEIREGGNVYEGQTLMYLPNMRKMQVEVGIHESLVSKVKPKQPAAIRIDSYAGVPFIGSVKSVAPLAESNWRSSSKNYKTIITIDEIPENVELKPGMTAQVELLIGYYPDVMVVPVQAVATHNDNKYVFAKNESGIFERTEIETNRSNISFIEVSSGIEEGTEVALDAFQRAANQFGDLDELAESTLSRATESLDTKVLKEIEEEEAKKKVEGEKVEEEKKVSGDANADPEAPPTVNEKTPDPEAPPTVNVNKDSDSSEGVQPSTIEGAESR